MGDCLKTIGGQYDDLILKHDGCRILQAIIKYGTKHQKMEIVEALKEKFPMLMT